MVTPLEIILLIANIVFIIIAVFLFIQLRKIEKKPESEIKQQPGLSGNTAITPMEFNQERFGIEDRKIPEPEKISEGDGRKIEASTVADLKLKDEDPDVEEASRNKGVAAKQEETKVPEEVLVENHEVPPEKTSEGEEKKIEASTVADLKLKDEIPDVEKAPRKKRVAAKKEETRIPEEALVENHEVPPEKIEIPEKIEFKFEEKEPEKEEEEPEKKESEKIKPVKKEKAAKKETKLAPKKKPAKKKKSPIGENI